MDGDSGSASKSRTDVSSLSADVPPPGAPEAVSAGLSRNAPFLDDDPPDELDGEYEPV
jgi:hypothetical protein